jgi:hypothetical protein
MKPSMTSVWAAAGTALAVHLLMMALYVAGMGRDVSALVGLPNRSVGTPPFEAVRAGIGPTGYDGQFYYALARNPWKRALAGVDAPAARHLRILYPAVSWLLSGGNARLLVWVLPAVNLAAIFALAWLGAWLAREHGLSAWWGFVLPVAVSAVVPALRDLTDPLAILAVCGLMVAWQRNWPWWALALWAATAVFSREQNVVVVLLMLGLATWKRQETNTVVLSAACALWGAWVILLRVKYGAWPFLPAGRGGTFGLPFAGLLHGWMHLGSGTLKSALLDALPLANAMLQLGLASYLIVRRRDGAVTALLAAGVLLALLSGRHMYDDPWSYTRVFAWLPVGIWLSGIRNGVPRPLLLLLPSALWPLAMVALVLKTRFV